MGGGGGSIHFFYLLCLFFYRWPYRPPSRRNRVKGVQLLHGRIKRRGQGSGPPPLKNHKNIGFPSNTGPDPLKNHKATEPVFNVGPPSVCQRNAIEMAFRWRVDDGPLLVLFWIIPPLVKLIKNVFSIGPPLTKLTGSAHDGIRTSISKTTYNQL